MGHVGGVSPQGCACNLGCNLLVSHGRVCPKTQWPPLARTLNPKWQPLHGGTSTVSKDPGCLSGHLRAISNWEKQSGTHGKHVGPCWAVTLARAALPAGQGSSLC